MQHELLNLIDKRQGCLDKSGVADTILLDLSKGLDCLHYVLILAKLYAYGVDMKSLELLQDYLSNLFQRVSLALREKCPNTEHFLVRMQENTDQKKLCIWTLFTQCWFYFQFMNENSIRGTTKISVPFLFNIFLNDILWFNEKTDICNFADDNTLYSCAQSINEVIKYFEYDWK